MLSLKSYESAFSGLHSGIRDHLTLCGCYSHLPGIIIAPPLPPPPKKKAARQTLSLPKFIHCWRWEIFFTPLPSLQWWWTDDPIRVDQLIPEEGSGTVFCIICMPFAVGNTRTLWRCRLVPRLAKSFSKMTAMEGGQQRLLFWNNFQKTSNGWMVTVEEWK